MTIRSRVLCVAAFSALNLFAVSASAVSTGQTPGALEATYGRLPIAFEENRGQAPSPVRFLATGPGYRIFLTDEEMVISRPAKRPIAMRLMGTRGDARYVAEEPLGSISNYLIGDSSRHITDVPNFAAVRRLGAYAGVDVRFYGNRQRLEYDFILAPGADPGAIRFAFVGPHEVFVNREGDLVLRDADGDLIQQRPVVYQEIDGQRRPIRGRYVVHRGEVAFRIAAYDPSKPLVIDPVLAYGSHEGGPSLSRAIAADSSGNAYVAGSVSAATGSTFPVVSAFDGSIGHGDTDAFVQKFNPTGTSLIYSTYLGGSTGADAAYGIAIDAGGNAYVTGTTNGSDFPTSTTAYQKGVTGGGSFVSKLGPAGNTLVYSTYVLNATAGAIAVDSSGNAFITGRAGATFATTAGAFQASARSTTNNAFVLELNPVGSGALYATFLGGSGTDQGFGIALDSASNAYIAGSTTSTDFPVVNAFRAGSSGGKEAFVSKLNAAGSGLVYSTYLGGSLDDYVTAIAVDAAGSAYVTGDTFSFDFPVLNAFQPVKGGVNISGSIDNAFVTKLAPAGDSLVYSSFLGGNACIGPGSTGCLLSTPVDIGKSIAVDAQGHAYVGGQTQSITFPLVDSLRPAVSSNGDAAFVVKVSARGGTLLYSTLLGGQEGIGNPQDFVNGLAVDGAGNVYGTGNIAGFPTTAGPYQNIGGAVVFKLSSGSASLALASSANPAVAGPSVVLTVTASDASLSGTVLFMDAAANIGIATLSNGVATFSFTPSVGIQGITAIFRNGSSELESPVLYQVTNPAAVCN